MADTRQQAGIDLPDKLDDSGSLAGAGWAVDDADVADAQAEAHGIELRVIEVGVHGNNSFDGPEPWSPTKQNRWEVCKATTNSSINEDHEDIHHP